MLPQSGQGGSEGDQVSRVELNATNAFSIVACKVRQPDLAESNVLSFLGADIDVSNYGM